MSDRKIIMGIDPGTNCTGYGFLEVTRGVPRTVVMGYIELNKLRDPYEKLRHIFVRVAALIDEYSPDEVALESPFFGENVQSMLKLGRAQGVAMAAALTRGVSVFEYAPRLVKQVITGNGAASKQQVARLLQAMLKIEYDLKRLDATDGLAVALCHHLRSSSLLPNDTVKPKGKRKKESWESFVAANPQRIKL